MSEIQQMNEQLAALRKAHEEGNASLVKELNAKLDSAEAKMVELAKKAEKAAELEEKFASMEADLKRGNFSGSEKAAKTEELKSFEKYLTEGKSSVQYAAEAKYLRSDNNENGGYLAPAQYVSEIIKNITEISPVRQVARVIPISSKEIEIPKRTGLISGGWVGEGQAASASNSTYGIEKLRAEKMMTYCDITFELARDAAFDLRAQVSADVAEDFAQIEGAAFISGNGVNKPEGLLTNSSVGEYNSGSSSTITPDALFAIQGEIKAGYNLTWMFNKKTLHQYIRTLKTSGSGEYLLQIGLGGLPNTVAGVPYVLANDMPDVAADAFPILLGDFRRAYYIVDNQGIEVIEDNVTQATSGKRRFIFFKRTGGQVVLPEAIKKMKIAS